MDDLKALEEQRDLGHLDENKRFVTPADLEKRGEQVAAPSRPAKPRDYEEQAKCELEALMDFGNTQQSLRHEKRRALKTPPGMTPACRRSLLFKTPHGPLA